MSSTRTDVLAARRGDSAAFARLVHDHASAVCAITTAILGSPGGGEEVGQEVFVCAWQGLWQLRDPDQFKPWLHSIARRRAHDALRNNIRRREVASDSLLQVADPAPDPGERLDGEQQESTLWAALEGLDEEHREVLVLYYREGHSVNQVADQLGLTEPTARKRLSRAREQLREDVAARLSQRMEQTAPKRAAFVAAVIAGIAAFAPPAQAAAATTVRAALGKAALAVTTALTIATFASYAYLRSQLPEIVPPARAEVAVTPVFGAVIALQSEPKRMQARQGSVPEQVVHAFLAAEDARFFAHGALDFRAIGRALLHNQTHDSDAQGGSTLTQQLAKNLLMESMPERSIRRKLSEAVMAFELERALTKEEILSMYLEEIYFGSGAWGLEEAAQLYFNKPASALTLAEGALLAGIPAHPQQNNPFDHPEGAEQRRAKVLDQMVANGWASPTAAAAAKRTALPIRRP